MDSGISPDSVRVISDVSGKSRGFGYADFEDDEQAEKLLTSTVEIEGRKLRFDRSDGSRKDRKDTKDSRNDNSNETPSRLLLLKNLSYSTTKEDIASRFDGASDIRLLTDRDSGLSRGLAFVEYKTTEEAVAARKEMHEQELDERKLNIVFATPREDLDKRRGGRGGGFRGGRGGGFRGGRGGRGGGGFRGGRGRGGFRGGRGRGRGRGRGGSN